jgi:hypothetical protein
MPQVLPGILIAKTAIWGFVLAASGQFAKRQSGHGPRITLGPEQAAAERDAVPVKRVTRRGILG